MKHIIRKIEPEKTEPIFKFRLEKAGGAVYLKVENAEGDVNNILNITRDGTLHLSDHVSIKGIVTEGGDRKIEIVLT